MSVPWTFLIVLTTTILPVFGQLQDDAPPDTKLLNAQVTELADGRAKHKAEFLDRMRQEVLKPLQTPGAAGNYVIDCMRKVQYEGKNGGNVDFAEWKKKNRDLFSNRDFERAAELHLRYLALTLWRGTLKTAEPVQAEVWSYLEALNGAQELVANVVREPAQVRMNIYDPREQKVTGQIVGDIENIKLASAANTRSYVQDLLNGGVDAGLVAQALKLTGHFESIPDWEMSPGNFSGIMEQDVRVELRKKKDPRLLTTWDSEISFLAAITDLKRDDAAREKFSRETYPRLIWKKAADAELLGLKNRALNIRLDIARKYPEHPDFEIWAKKIEDQIAELKTAAPAGAAPALEPIQPIQPLPNAPSPGDGPSG